MKNKGFTIVELLASFTLASIIIIILFQLIINLKELYMSSGIKTELLNKQYILTNKIYTDLLEKKLNSISKCEEARQNCINLTFSDGVTKEFYVDLNNEILYYGDYAAKVNNNSTFGTITISCDTITVSKKILTIKIPINNQSFANDDFGINIVYPFDTNDVRDTYNE